MKKFTESDIEPSSSWDGRIRCDKTDLIDAPLWWRSLGKPQTSTGYGRKLVTSYKISFCGRLLRVYCCCFANNGTCYVVTKGRAVIVDAM